MKALVGITILAMLPLCAVRANAADLTQFVKDGYGVAASTNVTDGTFTGCEFGKRVPLADGLVFVCSSYSYHYAFNPEVFIMKNVRDGRLLVVIDGERFDGDLAQR